MSVYRLVCSQTNRHYYGLTKNTIEERLSKGHYATVAHDFVNPTIHLVEACAVEDLGVREHYYINNFECINIKGKGTHTPNRALYLKKKSKQNRWVDKIKKSKKWHCALCDFSFTTEFRLQKHKEGNLHIKRNASYEIHGENWVHQYKKDNAKNSHIRRLKKKALNLSKGVLLPNNS